ncbi:hypothetical protein [Sulfurimonas sp. HSL-1716]|uniref:hypothetical protein n=1 Tax=Hydrocurvibacter sulfurireducens TaxID=3131937 RepID=UPI0031F8D528
MQNFKMKITIAELVDLVNEKTLLKLQRKVISKFEWTQNNKIRITYTNGAVEHYGCYSDCYATLNAKYRLDLQSYDPVFLPRSNIKELPKAVAKKKKNHHIERILLRLKKVLKNVEKSKKSIHLNMAEIQQALFSLKQDIFMANPYDLNVALQELYHKTYPGDKEMFVYFEKIKKELDSYG